MTLMPTDHDLPTTVLKRDLLGRVTTPKAQREALLDAFERSGLKGTSFARIAGVNYQTFASWIQKRRRERGDYVVCQTPSAKGLAPLARPSSRRDSSQADRRRSVRFMEAVMASPAVAAPMGSGGRPCATCAPVTVQAVEVLLSGGAIMRLAQAEQIPLAAHLLTSLRALC